MAEKEVRTVVAIHLTPLPDTSLFVTSKTYASALLILQNKVWWIIDKRLAVSAEIYVSDFQTGCSIAVFILYKMVLLFLRLNISKFSIRIHTEYA